VEVCGSLDIGESLLVVNACGGNSTKFYMGRRCTKVQPLLYTILGGKKTFHITFNLKKVSLSHTFKAGLYYEEIAKRRKSLFFRFQVL